MEEFHFLSQICVQKNGGDTIECISEVISYPNFYEGIVQLIKSHGLGSLQPNTILMTISDRESESIDDMIQIFESAQTYSKNILLYFEADDLPLKQLSEVPHNRKIIDVWWDPEDRDDFELMMGFVLSLRTSPVWTERSVNIRTIASDKIAKKHLERYFRTYFKKIRVKFKIQIHLEQDLSLVHCVHKYSEEADLIFFPLRVMSKFENTKDFTNYFKEVIAELPESTPTFAVSCYDKIDHKEIYL